MFRIHSPVIKATLQAAILSGISNILAQFLQARRTEQPLHINPVEVLRFVIVTLLTAPPNFRWQEFLERKFPAYQSTARPNDIPLTRQDIDQTLVSEEKRRDSNIDHESVEISGQKPRRSWKNTFIKLFIDSITVGALVNTVVFLSLIGFLKGHPYPKIYATVKRDTFPLIFAGYKLWPMVSIVSFTFIPVEKRIVFFSAFGLGWNIYMSIVASRI